MSRKVSTSRIFGIGSATLLYFTLLYLFIFGFSVESKASHILGGSLTHELIGRTPTQNIYRINYRYVFDCDFNLNHGHQPLPEIFSLKILNLNNGSVFDLNLNLIQINNSVDVSPDRICQGSSYCYRAVNYSGLFRATQNNGLNDVWRVIIENQSDLEDSEMHSIPVNSGTTFALYIDISPNGPGVPSITTNEVVPFCYNVGNLTRIDYSLRPPGGYRFEYTLEPTLSSYNIAQGIVTEIPYVTINGYSGNDPLGPVGDVVINRTTGIMTVTPDNRNCNLPPNGHYIVTIRVRMIKISNGQSVATFRRSVSLRGFDCFTFTNNVSASQLLQHPCVVPHVNGNQVNLANLNLSFGGSLIIDTDIAFQNGILKFSENVGVIFNRDKTLTLDNVQSFCCDENKTMWEGIECSRGSIIISNNSVVECAKTGLALTRTGSAIVTNSGFNENGIHILVNRIHPQNSNPIIVTGNDFTCYDPLIAPYSGKRTLTGISVIDNPPRITVNIGRSGATPNFINGVRAEEGPSNGTIKPEGSGIFVNNSNAVLENNTISGGMQTDIRMAYGIKVENYFQPPVVFPPELPQPPIVPERYTVTVRNNVLNDLPNGFYYTNYFTKDNITVNANTFNRIVSYANIINPLTESSRAIRFRGRNFRSTVNCARNIINDCRLGIEATGTLWVGISGNTIRSTSLVVPAITTFRGIGVFDIQIPNDENATNVSIRSNSIGQGSNTNVGIYIALNDVRINTTIHENPMSNVTHGIIAQGLFMANRPYPQFVSGSISGNKIHTIRRILNDADILNFYGPYSGIHLRNTDRVFVGSNDIINNAPNTAFFNQNAGINPRAAHGILLTGATSTILCSNKTTRLEHGITAIGACNSSIAILNDMEDNFFGFSVASQGVMGFQGAPTDPNSAQTFSNKWKTLFSPFGIGDNRRYSLYAFNNSNGGLTPFYTQPDLFPNPQSLTPNPLNNGMLSGRNDVNSTIIPSTVLSPPYWQYRGGFDSENSIGCGTNERVSEGGGIISGGGNYNNISYAQLKFLEDIARAQVIYDSLYVNEQKYTLEADLYDLIRYKSDLRITSTALDSFWLAKQGSNIAILNEVSYNLRGYAPMPTTCACTTAQNILTGLVPQNLIESNLKTVYTHLIDWIVNSRDTLTATQRSEILPIARQCPLSGGKGVYEALNLLSYDGYYRLDMMNNCMNIDYSDFIPLQPRLASNSKTGLLKMYPNPAQDQVHFSYDLETNGTGTLEIYDLKGAKITSVNLEDHPTGYDLSLSGWNSGVYICKITLNGQLFDAQKLIVE